MCLLKYTGEGSMEKTTLGLPWRYTCPQQAAECKSD